MKRELRHVGAPPPETTEPRHRYHVPRHLWPAAWEGLSESRAAFVTGLGLPAPDLDCAAPIEVIVAERGATVLERLGARRVGAGRDPWGARLAELERQRRAAEAERARHDAAAVDALEAAFRREAERKRAQLADGGEP